MPIPAAKSAPSVLTIDLAALTDNYKTIKARTKAAVGAAVKANGYGIGAAAAVQTLHSAGCRDFFVVTLDEALLLGSLIEMKSARLFVLGGLYAGAEDEYATHGIYPVLNAPDDITRWDALCKKQGKSPPCALHIDTGMNRLGLRAENVTADTGAGLNIEMVMSHFACADERDHALTSEQAKQFAKLAALFPRTQKSLCNSSGAFRNADWHYDVLRPGYALYGGNPTPEAENPMKPVVQISASVLQTRTVKKGESAGYGAGHVFTKDSTIATVAIGYADGLPRAGSGRVVFYYNGQPCPCVGRISMDVTMVDISALPQKPEQGDVMEILGPHQDVDALAGACGTIGYEILTGLGRRHSRIYKNEPPSLFKRF
jgi:alanine racemase